MDISISFTIIYFSFSLAQEGHAASWADVSGEVIKVTTIYEGKTSVIPLQDLSGTLNVFLGMQLLAINDFDDVAGILDLSTYLALEWTEEIYSGAHGSTAPDTSVTVSAANIWKPSLILVNAAGDPTEIVQEQSQVRIYLKSGKCEWTENVVLKASCKPNVYFYPFDVHDCSVKITTRAYNSSELILIASSFQKDHFEDSVSWFVKKTSAETVSQDSKSHLKFQITIARRPINYILNYVLPIVILSGLNIFVFILPRKSGERAGYSITCFLTFVVFMNTIVTSLPKSSAPVSVLVYYITVMMAVSAVITVIVLLTLIIDKKVTKEEDEKKKEENKSEEETKGNVQTENKNQITTKNNKAVQVKKHSSETNQVEPMPTGSTQDQSSSPGTKQTDQEQRLNDAHPPCCLQSCVWCLRLKCCACKDVQQRSCCQRCKDQRNTFGWVQIGNTVDGVCFIFFLFGEVIFNIIYLTLVSQQYYVEDLKLDLHG